MPNDDGIIGYIPTIEGSLSIPTASGTLTITSNGTGIDVTDYASVDVDVPTGGGGGEDEDFEPGTVVFIDYDGSIVQTYSTEDILAMSSEADMPTAPEHEGLVAQGWNWSLVDIKDYMTDYPEAIMMIGQMYITQSGATEIDLVLTDPFRLSPILALEVSGTIRVDWGDESDPDESSTVEFEFPTYLQHTYNKPGEYTIKIFAVDGEYRLYTSNGDVSGFIVVGTRGIEWFDGRPYGKCIKNVRIGNGIYGIASGAFDFSGLQTITIPLGVTTFGSYSLSECTNLNCLVLPAEIDEELPDGAFGSDSGIMSNLNKISLPNGIASIGGGCFGNTKIKTIAIPKSVTAIDWSAFYACSCLTAATIPEGVTQFDESIFHGCTSLRSISLPSNLETIPFSTFEDCYSLTNVEIPDNVRYIADSAFRGIYSLSSIVMPSRAKFHAHAFDDSNLRALYMTALVPPTIEEDEGNTFSVLPSDFRIYIPETAMQDYENNSQWIQYQSLFVPWTPPESYYPDVE